MSNRRTWFALPLTLAAALVLTACAQAPSTVRQELSRRTGTATSAPDARRPSTDDTATFAVIGDFGSGDRREQEVADLVKSWQPEFIVTVGDDYYDTAGGTGEEQYDRSVGELYGAWLRDGDNAFFPALGNHDYSDAMPGPDTYLAYFDLPGNGSPNSSGNERYYEFVEGPVHFFVLNSNDEEPDGIDANSKQARWLKAALAASTSPWNVVVSHYPPYSSDIEHGSNPQVAWPFAEWGADVVLNGHAHTYERIERDGIVYLVNGLGGDTPYEFDEPVEGSAKRFNEMHGAQRVTATPEAIAFEFISTDGTVIDRREIAKP